MTIQQELVELERRFWTEGPDFYRNNLAEECLVAFEEMSGLMKKEQIAETVQESRWKELEISAKGLVEPSRDVAILCYEASAKRQNGEPYAALVSSGYVRRRGAWKLAFHQQTPRH